MQENTSEGQLAPNGERYAANRMTSNASYVGTSSLSSRLLLARSGSGRVRMMQEESAEQSSLEDTVQKEPAMATAGAGLPYERGPQY